MRGGGRERRGKGEEGEEGEQWRKYLTLSLSASGAVHFTGSF